MGRQLPGHRWTMSCIMIALRKTLYYEPTALLPTTRFAHCSHSKHIPFVFWNWYTHLSQMLIALNMLSHCFLYLRLTLIYPSQYSVLFCLALKRYLCTGCNVVTPVCLLNTTLPYLLRYTLYLLLGALSANPMFHSLSLSNMAALFANSSSPHSTQWSTYSSSYSPPLILYLHITLV